MWRPWGLQTVGRNLITRASLPPAVEGGQNSGALEQERGRLPTGRLYVLVKPPAAPPTRTLDERASHRVTSTEGAVAQLGEHLVCNQGVAGSIPVRSTVRPHM